MEGAELPAGFAVDSRDAARRPLNRWLLTARPGPLSIGRGSTLLVLAQISANAGYFVAVLILARVLEPAGRGAVAFITVTAGVLARVAVVGFDQATIVLAAQRPPDRRTLLANLYGFTLLASTCLSGSLVAALWLAGVTPAGITRGELLLLAGGSIAGALTDAGFAFLLGLGRPGDWTRIAAAAPWLYALLLGGLALAGRLDVFLAALAWLLAHSLWAAVAAAVCARRAGGFSRPRIRLAGAALRLGVRAWVGSLSRFLNFRLDQIILGLLATQAVLGTYATAVNLSEVTLYIPGAVASASIAALAASAAPARHELALQTFRTILLVTAATVVVAALAGAPLLPVVFGAAYSGSVGPYLLLLPGALGYTASGVFSSALLGSERPLASSVGPLVSLVGGVVGDLLLIPPFGSAGAAAAASAAFVLGGAAAIGAYRRAHALALRELVPGRADVARLLGTARRLRLRG